MGSVEGIVQPIIQDIGAYSEYPFEAIDQPTLDLLDRATSRVSYGAKSCKPVTRALECFLQLTGRQLTLTSLTEVQFATIGQEFLGALHSDRFIAGQAKRRYVWADIFLRQLQSAKTELSELVVLEANISTKGPTAFVKSCVSKFEDLRLNRDKVRLWQGWPSTNRSGRTSWLPLYSIYTRLGEEFTERLYKVCDEYYSGRKSQRIVGLAELVKFIHQYPNDLDPTQFSSPSFVSRFWREFYYYYIRSGHGAGIDVRQLTTNWRNEFAFFVKEYLVRSGLFAEQYGSLPSTGPVRKFGHETHISNTTDGIAVKTKLITPVPLQVSDSEAMEILFRKIEEDFQIITTWASWAVGDIWKRFLRRIVLAPQGKVRQMLAPREFFRYAPEEDLQSWVNNHRNPEYLQNIAASFAHYGYLSSSESSFVGRLFPPPRDRAAFELALPTTGALLPHCVILVARHPKITPSFLENFELYDKFGQRTGLHKTDAGYVLDGRKDRNGPLEGQQIVVLTHETAKIVLQIIVLTNTLRKFLRARGDENWRYLLLTCGEGFAYPLRIKRIATDTSMPQRLESLAQSLGNTSSLPYESRLEYVRRFSLPALRAQAGVLIYLKEHSARKMAEALGHKDYFPDLLDRYLPRPIREFFQERWIRIFQTGIIVEALKDSPYLLRASSFESMSDLDEFLRVHVLKKLDTVSETANSDLGKSTGSVERASQAEVVFGVNAEILASMIGLQTAVQMATLAVSGKARYWAAITDRLIKYVESEFCIRSDLKNYLIEARAAARPEQFYDLIYE